MISSLFLGLGILLVALGIWGMLRMKTLHARAMASTIVDTTGYLCILVGILLRWPRSFITLKIGMIIFLMLIINTLFVHFLLQSAWKSGHKENIKKGDEHETGDHHNP